MMEDLVQHTSLPAIQTERATRSMYEFLKQSWTTIEPGREFHDNWHIESICEHLQAVAEKKLTRLIINIPPRHMKSLTCAVAFPTWTWINHPQTQFLFASYAADLARRDSVKCRRLIQSPWYSANWSQNFHLTGDQNQKARFENNHNGHRISTSVGGALTGEGGDIIVIDDPHNVKEAESEQVRQSTLEWWDTAVQSRLNDPKTGAFVVIMQRVHQADLVGHILAHAADSGEEWTHLCVPAEYEENHPHRFVSTLPTPAHPKDPRTEEGALLWPSRFGQKELDRLKTSLGSYAAAGQLQQRPSPKGGGIIKRHWWRKWETQIPQFLYVIQSWDTAFSNKDVLKASYSACTTWGVFAHSGRYHIMLMHRFRERMEYPELRRRAKELYSEYAPDAVIVEKKASGHSLIQDMRQGGIPVIPYTPDRDKVSRAHTASVLIESGIVWYPDRRWAEEVVEHCAVFPAGDGTDIVDTVSQALIRLKTMWYGSPEEDDHYDPELPDRYDPIADNIVSFPKNEAVYG